MSGPKRPAPAANDLPPPPPAHRPSRAPQPENAIASVAAGKSLGEKPKRRGKNGLFTPIKIGLLYCVMNGFRFVIFLP